MKKTEKFLWGAVGVFGLAGVGFLWLIKALNKHTVRCRINFAGQRPGVGIAKSSSDAAILYCSTKFDPHLPEKAAAACWIAVSVLLSIIAVVHYSISKQNI